MTLVVEYIWWSHISEFIVDILGKSVFYFLSMHIRVYTYIHVYTL